MNKRQATALYKKIEADPTIRVEGFRHWDTGGYEIEAVDLLSGYRFIIRSEEGWQDRLEAREFYKSITYGWKEITD